MTDDIRVHEDEYEEELLTFSADRFGAKDFFRPVVRKAVARVLDGLDVRDKLVLDIGCGLGGVDVLLARGLWRPGHGPGNRRRPGPPGQGAHQAKTACLTKWRSGRAKPGAPCLWPTNPWMWFSARDSWIHIQGQGLFFFQKRFRVLKPGGLLTAGDWMRAPGSYSRDMLYFFEMEGLTYHMDTQEKLWASARRSRLPGSDGGRYFRNSLLPQAPGRIPGHAGPPEGAHDPGLGPGKMGPTLLKTGASTT